jgi:hypothetical protein
MLDLVNAEESMTVNERAVGPTLGLVQSKLPGPRILLVVATALAIPFVFFTTFNGMSWFDDEGTLLVGFRSLLDGYRMYDDIYSLYGPLYNLLYGLVYVVFHVPLTHMAGRLIAATLWLIYTAGFTTFCHRLTRSTPATLVAYLLVLIWLAELMDSPGHPEELCLLLVVAVLLLACSLDRAADSAMLAGMGAAVAGLALIKINIGVYVGGAVVLVLLCITARAAWTRIAIPLVTIALLFLPFAVQAPLFDFGWARMYSLLSTLTTAAALLVFLNFPDNAVLRAAHWLIIALGGGLICLTVIGALMLAGSSLYAIFDATVMQNMHFIRNWNVPLDVGPKSLMAAVVSLVAALAYCASGSWSRVQGYRDLSVVALKLGFVLFAVPLLLFASPERVFKLLVPFCWLLMVQPKTIGERYPIGRGVAGLIGATLSLYPFPVAGHQLRIGALLPVLMVPILAHDLLKRCVNAGSAGTCQRSCIWGALTMTMVLAIGAIATLRSASAYWHGVPLGLPGTGLIRTDQKQADDLRWVTAQLSSCASSYSMPGLLSFTFWTGHALPTTLNINDVLAFIRPAQQQGIIEALSRQSDLCVVYNPEYLQSFDCCGQIESNPPLLNFLRTEFISTAERNGYLILKRRASALQPPESRDPCAPDRVRSRACSSSTALSPAALGHASHGIATRSPSVSSPRITPGLKRQPALTGPTDRLFPCVVPEKYQPLVG